MSEEAPPVHGAHDPPACPVCRASDVRPLLCDGDRDYWSCAVCEARYLAPSRHPTRDVELAHYVLHRNDTQDPRYRAFLAKLAEPLLARLEPASSGLDYGCGPGPALAAMLREAGHAVALYDPFFAADESVLSRTYDFVTCTEVAEHFHDPAREFRRLVAMIRPGGWLAVMTCFQTDDARFRDWHYRKDPTHVVFYREATFRFIARRHGLGLECPVKDVALMRKPAVDDPFPREGGS